VVIKCDRCGVSEEIDRNDLPSIPLPPNWNVLDGSHVCPPCDGDFRKFMAQKRPR
jgi:hypothetical protein